MKMSKPFLLLAITSIGFFSVALIQSALSATPKFSKTAEIRFPKACGNGLDEHSACGDCAYVGGVGVTKSTRCGHVCVKLPAGKSDKDMNLSAYAAIDGHAPNFRPCGTTNQGGPCGIDYSRFESNEYYVSTNELCGRFKNWSADRGVIFRIVVTEK